MVLAWRPLLNSGLVAVLAGLAALGLALVWQRIAQPPHAPAGGEQVLAGGPGGAASDRDPFAPPAGLGPPAPRQDLPEVLGVVISRRETIALVRLGAAVKRVRPGESVGRYRLQEVLADRLVFQEISGGRKREILIRKEFAVPDPQKKR